MIIRFTSIEIQGFMSIGKATVDLTDRGLVLVKGKNLFEPLADSNGSGKSALFESIIWTLTGMTSRGSSRVVNKYTSSGTVCALSLYADDTLYKIVRTEDSSEYGNSLVIYKDGEDISGNTRTKSKKILESELPKLSYDILTSIIVMSQGLPGRLSSLKPSQRKSRLESLSSSDYYLWQLESKMDRANTELSSKKMTLIAEKSRLDGTISSSKRSIGELTTKIKSIVDQQGTIISSEVAESHRAEIASLQSEMSVIMTNSNKLRSDLNAILQAKSGVDYQVNMKKARLSELASMYSGTQVGSVCPTCNKPMNDAKLIEDIQSKYMNESLSIKQELGRLLSDSSSFETKSVAYNEQLGKLDAYYNELNTKCGNLSSELIKYEKFSNSTDALEESIVSNQKAIDEAEALLVSVNSEMNSLELDIKIHSYLKRMMTKQFRSFLLEGTIDYLNSKCAYYSKMLFEKQGVVNLKISGNNIDVLLGNDTYFEELSGGESRKVDLILQLAQRDLAQNESGLTSNILVLDEVLDYLDPAGIEAVIELIESKSSDIESILMVSHKNDIKLPYDTVITVTKSPSRVSSIQ